LLRRGFTPQEFWNAIIIATPWHLAAWEATAVWEAWDSEIRFARGCPPFHVKDIYFAYLLMVQDAEIPLPQRRRALLGERMAAIEHLLDVTKPDTGFADSINKRARFLRGWASAR